tara:strand:- start:297 stop:479 length:183 start_codon:yes stop_codon:yes gene_type:complete
MRLTKPQQQALKTKWMLWSEEKSYLAFRRTVELGFCMDGAVIVPWNGMWLAIETDGYAHT